MKEFEANFICKARIYITPSSVSQIPYISGGAVNNNEFIFDSLHFHWGENDINGSEHSINNHKYSAEVSLP